MTMADDAPPPMRVPGVPDSEITGKRLDEVAKVLAGAFVAVTGVMAGLGLTSERVFIALNNSSNSLWISVALAFAAFTCSIVALFIPRDASGNARETGVLILGGAAFIAALAVGVSGAADSANGNGRATITNVKIEGKRPELQLSFDVHADGVQKDSHLTAFVHPSNLEGSKISSFQMRDAFLVGTLRPDDKAIVDHKVAMPFAPGEFTHLTIFIATSEDKTRASCEVDSDKGPACAILRIP
ncbi:hypothetical protein AB0D29_10825 [Streptomyces sp. NPDC048424]|uniref:hypothetical protein n=1 Tax=Streptomyces sp. NPDC048424 TaxID=3155265 RepID=UPI00343FB7B4